MKDSNVKESILCPFPKPTYADVRSGIMCRVGAGSSEDFALQRREQWLHRHVRAHLRDYVRYHVSYLFMSNGREAPGWAAHRMSRGEILATCAFLRDIPQRPSVPQRNGIAEVALGQTEAVLTQQKGVEPARYTLGRKVFKLAGGKRSKCFLGAHIPLFIMF